MFSQFVINRPKFAFVISIVITLIGLISLLSLPVTQYPNITPPSVSISAVYPGADAETVEKAVIRPIEEQVNGVEGMIYVSSSAGNDGSASITVTFESGVDEDVAQINVQNRVAAAEPKLPEEVRRMGINVQKQASNWLLGVNIYSPNGTHDGIFLNNYAENNLKEPLARISGVASAAVMGPMTYSMRIWTNPKRMSSLDVTTNDITTAINEQNVIVAAGKLGEGPNLPGQQFTYTIRTEGRLSDPSQFENIVIRSNPDGSAVRLKDVARIELGAQEYRGQALYNGNPTAFLSINQLPSANAMEISKDIKAEMARLAKSFPDDVAFNVPFDTTDFIEESMREVVVTLFQAVALVILVVFLFLQNFRATLIPAIAIPVSLIGTFAILNGLGFSINTITLFGLVLAIGVVVDDAIVVIENVERLMVKEKLSPKEATSQAMKEVAGPIVATTLVLLAVFVPVGFMPGITGGLYTQFAVTISVAVLISSINALTLSPALCVTLLKSGNIGQITWLRPVENMISKLTGGYTRIVTMLLRRSIIGLALFVGMMVATGYMFQSTPSGFIPDEDQGFLMVDIQLPDAASVNRTDKVLSNVEHTVAKIPGVRDVITISGYSLMGGSNSNVGMAIVMLDDWAHRPTEDLHQASILKKIQGSLWSMPDAQAIAFGFPAIPGLGTSNGFDFRLQDTAGRSPQELGQVMGGLVYAANQDPRLSRVFSSWRANVPQFYLNVDRDKAKTLGIPMSEIYSTLQTQLGSLYVNDFNKFGRNYQVKMMAESQFRTNPADLHNFYVRNAKGEMVPLTTVASLKPILGPSSINHYNLYRSVSISGQAAPGYSSGDAIAAMKELASQLPDGYSFEWSGQSKQEIEAGNLAPLLFALAFLFVYLFLVAQYESWSMPIAIISAVPVATFGAFGGLNLMRTFMPNLANDVYAQIGMVLLVGIAAKTAILIVEFAMVQRREGKSIFDAAVTASGLRFRAVLMTALSFILGVLPLIMATGAGAASRQVIGVAVSSGMLAATIFGVLLIPVFYLILQNIREKLNPEKAHQ